MKIYVYPADDYGCGHYRMMWPAAAVRDLRGMDVTVIPTSGETQIAGITDPRGGLKKVIYPPDADVIVFQRPTHRFLALAIPMLREEGVACVVDMDDDLRTIHPNNPAFVSLHPRGGHTMHTWRNAAESCRNATLVTVSTPALVERYASHGRVRVIPNRIPQAFLDIEHSDSTLIGWGGSVHSHPNDLQVIGAGVARVVADGTDFKVIGTGEMVAKHLGLPPTIPATGLVPFHDWGHTLTQLGIGIAPLADTVFNAAKSWLKPLEYAAVGVPWVGSDRVEYRRLHDRGCGIVVEKPREWERALRSLVNDDARRADLSAQGREVAAELTIEGGVDTWYEAWSAAWRMERVGDLVTS
jgi:hypothetical protein